MERSGEGEDLRKVVLFLFVNEREGSAYSVTVTCWSVLRQGVWFR